MFEWIFTFHGWVALVTLTVLEIVLGIDNIIFISVIVSKLPADIREKARRIGLAFAMISRLLLLTLLFWLSRLSLELFSVFGQAFSVRDLVLILGGMFLIWKSTMEIHDNVEGEKDQSNKPVTAGFAMIILQIGIIDLVFSLDSVITAIGMAEHLTVMASAIILAVFFMLFSARIISGFVERHPTIKILALSFLLMVGLALVADGFDMHIPKGYIYFAMAFSVFVESLNLRIRNRASQSC